MGFKFTHMACAQELEAVQGTTSSEKQTPAATRKTWGPLHVGRTMSSPISLKTVVVAGIIAVNQPHSSRSGSQSCRHRRHRGRGRRGSGNGRSCGSGSGSGGSVGSSRSSSSSSSSGSSSGSGR